MNCKKRKHNCLDCCTVEEWDRAYQANKKRRPMEKQQEFKFMDKTREQTMKEISEEATKQLKAILDEIIKKKEYSEEDIKNIAFQSTWIEKI